MESYTIDQYQELIANSTILEKDRRGIKVLCTAQGQMVKFFRLKSFWSSALFKPYAKRFSDNAHALKTLGIETVTVQKLFYCQPIKRYLVFYDPVPGHTLRDTLSEKRDHSTLLDDFARFLAEMHRKGVLFRSVHFGNLIIIEGDRGFGLIDIADMKIRSKPLSVDERVRNFRHMTRYDQDVEALKNYGLDRFIERYLCAAKLTAPAQGSFLKQLTDSAPFFANRDKATAGH